MNKSPALRPKPTFFTSKNVVAPGQAWIFGFWAAIFAGILFRLIWPADMEYKGDETWTFSHVADFFHQRQLPLIGMMSSAGVPNAGMSFWVFLAIGAFAARPDPLELARGVQWMSIAALLLLAAFARLQVEREEREAWLWSAALAAVNPLQVLLQRKIWAQSVLPLFSAVMLIGWWHRGRRWGAFLWGFVGVLLGQIHMSGFFFDAAFFLCVLCFDRGSVRWPAWWLGSLLGAVPMLPWLRALFLGGAASGQGGDWVDLVPFFPLHWLAMSLGVRLDYSLGSDFFRFLAWPSLGGVPLYAGAIAIAAILSVFAMILRRFARIWGRDGERTGGGRQLLHRLGLIALPGASVSSTLLALNAASWIFGLLLAATRRPLYLHYFVVLFTLPALWLARLALAGSAPNGAGIDRAPPARGLLAAMVIAQAVLTLIFLWFIHDTKVIDGDYGTVYHAQLGHPE